MPLGHWLGVRLDFRLVVEGVASEMVGVASVLEGVAGHLNSCTLRVDPGK